MSTSPRSLGLADFDKLREQIDEVLNPASRIAREYLSTQRYAEQIREMTTSVGAARGAWEEFQRHEHSVPALARDAARFNWPSQLAELERMSSLYAGNDVLNQITEQARHLSEVARDVERLANSQSAFEQVLDHARELTSGSSLQLMLEGEATRLQRALAPMPDIGVLDSAVPQLQEMLNRERRQWESLISQVAGPAGLSFEHDVSLLHEELALRASELSQYEPYFQDAINLAKQFKLEQWSPGTVRSVLNAVRWDELLAATEARTETAGSKGSTRGGIRRKVRRWQLTYRDLILYLTVLSALFTIIGTLFESGLIQRFDVREPPPTPVPIAHPRVERWAIATLPTTLFVDPSERAAALFRVPVGAWLRVREQRASWLLVEVEVGERSRLQGWMRTLASRDLQDDVWQRGLHALGQAMGEVPVNSLDEPADLPDAVRRAGEDAVKAYAAALASLKSSNTRAAYQRAFERFFAFCSRAGLDLTSVSAIDVIAYLTGVSQQHSAASAKQHLIALRKLFEYLQVADVVTTNPTVGVNSPKPAPRPVESVEGEDVERLLQSLVGTKEAEVRDRAIVTLIAGLGLKVSQLTALTIGAVENDSEARLQLRLGPRRERIAVPAAAYDALEAYVSLRRVAAPPDAPLFVSTRVDIEAADGGRALARGEIYAMLQRRAEACGIPEISCEGLRHASR